MGTFGPFVLEAGQLSRDGKPVALGSKALALLAALEATDGPVSKDVLLEAAWPGTLVEDNNLTVQIAALRKALGSRDDGSEWVTTVPRVGYRLMRTGEGARRSTVPTIAVMPFQAIGGSEDQAGLAD